MNFWKEFLSSNHTQVNSMTVLALVLSAPVVLVCFLVIIYHVFFLKHGLDGTVSNLLTYMLAAATGGIVGQGVTQFTKTDTPLATPVITETVKVAAKAE